MWSAYFQRQSVRTRVVLSPAMSCSSSWRMKISQIERGETRWGGDDGQISGVLCVQLDIESVADLAIGIVGRECFGAPGGRLGWHLARRR